MGYPYSYNVKISTTLPPASLPPPLLKSERTLLSLLDGFPQQGFKLPNCSVTARLLIEIFCARTRHRRIRRTWAWQVS